MCTCRSTQASDHLIITGILCAFLVGGLAALAAFSPQTLAKVGIGPNLHYPSTRG